MTCSCGKPLKYRTRSCIDCFTRDRKARERPLTKRQATKANKNRSTAGVDYHEWEKWARRGFTSG